MDSLALESGLSPTTVLPRMERRERESLPLRLIQCVILDQHLTSHQRAKSNINQKQVSGFPYSSVGKESTCNARDPDLIPGSRRSPGEGIGYPLHYSWASLGGSDGNESICNAGDPSLIPGSRRSPGEWIGYQSSILGLLWWLRW